MIGRYDFMLKVIPQGSLFLSHDDRLRVAVGSAALLELLDNAAVALPSGTE
jgi:hypothetical protein